MAGIGRRDEQEEALREVSRSEDRESDWQKKEHLRHVLTGVIPRVHPPGGRPPLRRSDQPVLRRSSGYAATHALCHLRMAAREPLDRRDACP